MLKAGFALATICAASAAGAMSNGALDPANAGAEVYVIGRDGTFEQSVGAFGTTSVDSGAHASVAIGLGAGNAPVVSLQNNDPSTRNSFAYASGQLRYSWEIVGSDNSPVLVHAHVSGSVGFSYAYQALQGVSNVNPGTPSIIGYVSLSTSVPQGDIGNQYWGFQTGDSYQPNVATVAATENFGPTSGTSVLSEAFDESFDMWVIPNIDNGVYIRGYSFVYDDCGCDTKDGSFFSSVNIDPTFTIDAAYTDRYSLIQDDIPAIASVPEPSVPVSLLLGLAVVGAAGVRRRAGRALTA